MANRRNRKSGQNRREQTPKQNRAMMEGFQELRRGSRTSPIPAGGQYRRKPKHNDWSKED